MPTPVLAHPHEFVDVAVSFRFDARGRLDSVGVRWLWDDLTSMLMAEDFGLDADGDGTLTEDERAALVARFTDWPDDFDGDLYLSSQGAVVEMSGPRDLHADMRDGRLEVDFTRSVGPLDLTGPLVMQAYDPSYYVAYDLDGAPRIEGRDGCSIDIRPPDIAAAQQLYARLLGQLTEAEIMELGKSPEVGGAFADEVTLICAAQP